MELKLQPQPLIKAQLKTHMYLCFIICCCTSVPIIFISLLRAKVCEGSWSGPSGSWLGREPFMPKCTSEREHTGCVKGLRLEMSKHFAYPRICGINHDKVWISLSFKYLKIVSRNYSWVLSYCLLASERFLYLKPPPASAVKPVDFWVKSPFQGRVTKNLETAIESFVMFWMSAFWGAEDLLSLHHQPWDNGKYRYLERWRSLGLPEQTSVLKCLMHLQPWNPQSSFIAPVHLNLGWLFDLNLSLGVCWSLVGVPLPDVCHDTGRKERRKVFLWAVERYPSCQILLVNLN